MAVKRLMFIAPVLALALVGAACSGTESADSGAGAAPGGGRA